MKVTDNTAKVGAYIKELQGKVLAVGIPGEFADRKEDQGPMNNAVLGYIHEFGVPGHIPPRPFLVPGFERAQGKAAMLIGIILKAGGTVEEAFAKAGELLQASVKTMITAGLSPGLAASTLAARKAWSEGHNKVSPEKIAAKGYKPLIRTGQLLNSIHYVVRARGNNA
jgi:hypothetical protein